MDLKRLYPDTDLKVIADDGDNIQALSDACTSAGVRIGVMVDVNTGMNRTGALPGAPSLALAQQIAQSPGLCFAGLHVYDGHVGDFDGDMRQKTAIESIGRAVETRCLIEQSGIEDGVEKLVASGSPGFEHTQRVDGVDEVSPGTWIFWDMGYGDKLQSPFEWAALILSSVIQYDC